MSSSRLEGDESPERDAKQLISETKADSPKSKQANRASLSFYRTSKKELSSNENETSHIVNQVALPGRLPSQLQQADQALQTKIKAAGLNPTIVSKPGAYPSQNAKSINPQSKPRSKGESTSHHQTQNEFYDFLTRNESQDDGGVTWENANAVAEELGIGSSQGNHLPSRIPNESSQEMPNSNDAVPIPPETTNLTRQRVVIPTSTPGAYSADLDGVVPTEPVRLSGLARANVLAAAATATAAAEDPNSLEPGAEASQEFSARERGSSKFLVTANPVGGSSNPFMPTAEEVPEPSQSENEKKSIKPILVGVAFAVLGVIIAGVLLGVLLSKSSSDTSETIDNTPSPTMAPTLAPTSVDDWLVPLLPDYTVQALSDPDSPQSKAYEWTLEDPSLSSYPPWRIQQRFALATTYYATNGDGWNQNEGWLDYNVNECEWHSSYISYDLAQYALGSLVMADYWNSSICTENQYQHLRLYTNQLQGTVPRELFLLTALQTMYLITNELVGTIPTLIGQLDKLEVVALVGNELTGGLPSEIGLNTLLRALAVFSTPIGGSLPSEMGLLTNMEELFFDNCQVMGSIPSELGSLTKLRYFDIHANKLGGQLPSQLGLLESIENLGFRVNRLGGTIPSEVGQLANLESLMLQQNRLTGEVPSTINGMTNLNYLDLSWNDLSGQIPEELFSLTNLNQLYLERNTLSGTLSSRIGELTELLYFWFQGNELSGRLPSEISEIWALQWVNIHENAFTGPIPSELSVLFNFTWFQAHSNKLSGQLPSQIGLLSSLEHLDLSFNDLSGSVPEEFDELSPTLNLNISDNPMLSGTLPVSVCNNFYEFRFDCTETLCGCECNCPGT